MNFFENQDRARSKTTQLAFLFALAVAGIIVGLYLASRVALKYGMGRLPAQVSWWDLQDFLVIAIVGVAFIAIASALRMNTLRSGGSAVAEMLGGRLVHAGTKDFKERRLLNVVEEMAIASGVPVPLVYVLDEEKGINAFAAGHSTSDAAVAVTRGCLDTLNRDELQGVIGHEFSHILNGDMRLNIRLIGILFGIFAMTIVGRILARAAFFSGRGSSKRGGGAPAALMGLALILVGYIGLLVGRIIQSAVSRQREFLADASAVQFTRNPRGIASALKKIGGYSRGSRIESPKAEQASHMFFGQGQKLHFLTGIFATHPPLAERIRRIDSTFRGEFPPVEAAGPEADRALGPDPALMGLVGAASVTAEPGGVAQQVGNPTVEHLSVGVALRGMIPKSLEEAVANPQGATHTVYALLLEPDAETRDRELETLGQHVEPGEIDAVRTLYAEVQNLHPRARLPLLDLAMPSLRRLSRGERERFLARVIVLVAADEKLTLFEFAVQWMVTYRLGHAELPPRGLKYRSVGPLLKDIALLLSAMAHAGNPGDAEAAGRAFHLGAERIVDPDRASLPLTKAEDVQFEAVGKVFDRMALATYQVRGKIIDACAHCAFADRTVTTEEAELLRVVSLALDCPLPPFLGHSGDTRRNPRHAGAATQGR